MPFQALAESIGPSAELSRLVRDNSPIKIVQAVLARALSSSQEANWSRLQRTDEVRALRARGLNRALVESYPREWLDAMLPYAMLAEGKEYAIDKAFFKEQIPVVGIALIAGVAFLSDVFGHAQARPDRARVIPWYKSKLKFV
jgi:hypothetical protein